MYQVVKRNGKLVEFNLSKISSAIKKAFDSQNKEYNDDVIDMISLKVTSDFSNKIKEGKVNVEDIQDSVEKILQDAGFGDVAKSYILYRSHREKIRYMRTSSLNYKELVDSYVHANDWRVKENSTVTYSVGGLILSNSGAITANYWLTEIYDEEISKAHRNADIHIHDLSMLTGYCFTGDTRIKTLDGKNWSFEDLVKNNVHELEVFAYDKKEKKIVTALAINPRITREVKDLIKITLSTGKVITSTVDHPYMLRDGSYLEAGKLKLFTSLMGVDNNETISEVFSIEKIDLEESIKVYDLTVPVYSNFALDAGVFVHNCAGWSLKQLIKEGLGGIPGKITSAPAKHLATLCNQMVNFLGIMQNEWAGAQAFSSFDTYLAAFVKADSMEYGQVEKCIESFIYGVNTPSRWGTQAPFSNITLDWVVPEDLSELQAIVGGKEMSFKYKDCKKEMDMVNKAFIKVMLDGDADGRGFQYPIPTYSITKEFDWSETENNKLLFEMTSKYGTPYFSNYVNSDMKPSDTRSMCCRLRLDLRELRKKSGGFFGSGESTGSVGVVTINLPRISYLAKNEEEFFKRLDKMMDISARSLKVKRQTVSKLLEDGLYPYTKHYLGSFNNHFSTIATIGINEVCINAKWIRKDLTNKEAQEFSKKLLNHMRDRLSDYQEQYGDLYNIEAAPAESTCFRLAKFDKQKYPEIITAAKNPTDTPYYTNSSHLPVGYTEDIYSALDIQDDLQTLYTSGTVFHAFLGEKLPSWKSASDLVRKIAENYKLPYYTLSPVYSICSKHGYLSGDQKKCPICCGPTETYSRITGYYRPVQNWNDGKSQEFKDRKLYDIDHSILNVKVPISTESTDPVLNINPVVDTSKDLLLFTTKTCPNCSMVKMILGKTDLQYDVIDAEEKTDLSIKFGIKQVPVLVVLENGIIKKKYENVSEIKKFVKG